MPSPNEERERRVFKRVVGRLVPFMFVCYVIAYIDRVNIGFAAPYMQRDLAMSNTVYGFGAGLFFFGYFLFEVPSNLILERVGARRWIARIMIVWGLVSMAMMFVEGKWSFYSLRVLLGLAEAGFFPGMILYLTYWIPARQRAKTGAHVHDGDTRRHADRQPGLRGAAQARRPGRPAGMAMAISGGRVTGRHPRVSRSQVPDRPSGESATGCQPRIASG